MGKLCGEYLTWAHLLMHHMMTAGSPKPVASGAHDRRQFFPTPWYRCDNSVPNRLLERRLGILSWNSGPRRGREDATADHIAVKWHVTALQEATNHFNITHDAGCAVLGNKDTIHSDINVKSIQLHVTSNGQQQAVKEGQSGWVLQAIIPIASFRRIPRNGKSYFFMMSLHINNHFAEKRGIGKNLLLTVRTVCTSNRSTWVISKEPHGAASRAAMFGP